MAEPIRFYFDFVSSYSYIPVQQLDAMLARYGRTADWRVVSLPHIFKAIGAVSPRDQPLKLAHVDADIRRACAMAGLPFIEPATRPFEVRLPRLLFWRCKARDERLAHEVARALSAQCWGEGRSIGSVEAIAAALRPLGLDEAEIAAAETDAAAKAALVAASEAALADGMFGAPFLVADGERFWGADRCLAHLEWRLGGTRRQIERSSFSQ
jgi:2-hydroxychromene-2-carboxylate isomerase